MDVHIYRQSAKRHSGHDICEGNKVRLEMAPLLPNRDENQFSLSTDYDNERQPSPSVSPSSHNRRDCPGDAAASDAPKRTWYNEHASSTIDTRYHEIHKPISPGTMDTPVSNLRLNKARRERRRSTRSPTSSCAQTRDISTMPYAIACDSRHKSDWLKARVQHERNQKRRQGHNSEIDQVLVEVEKRAVFTAIGPERKQTAFVKEEELKNAREDRAGTPHISELQADDDVFAPFSVEELSMGGETEALAKTWHQ